jgi:hypothetical protein
MEYVGDGVYSQIYHSPDFFLLQDVLEYEDERLWGLGVRVTDYEFSVALDDGEVVRFYLELFFESKDGKDLSYKQLFNYKNREK